MNLTRISHLVGDIALCLTFFTRIPCHPPANARNFADALWAAPVVGALVGVLAAVTVLIGSTANMSPHIAALLALAVSIVLTGALHEDGAADTADGFGGGKSAADSLQIMRDSRIGTYGTLALLFSFAARWAAISAIASADSSALVFGALMVAHAGSRGVLPVFIAHVPTASTSGLSAGIGPVRTLSWGAALVIGCSGMLAMGLAFALVAAIALASCMVVMNWLCRRAVGGQTGDVLGALQQLCECALLLVAASLFG